MASKFREHGTSGSNAPLTVTVAAVANKRHRVAGLVASYEGAIGAGVTTLKEGANVLAAHSVTNGAPLVVSFDVPLDGAVGAAVSVEMTAGGVACVGRATVYGFTDD